MYSFKSSPLIQNCSKKPKRIKKREPTCFSKSPQYKIANPFKSGEQQNFLPHQLIQQIQTMEYISSTAITKINLPDTFHSQRRNSNFARHLHMMQDAARKQQQKFQGLVNNNKQEQFQQEAGDMMNSQMPLSISELDDLSIDMENCLNQMKYRTLDQEFGIFDQAYEPNNTETFYYSQHDIQNEFDYDFQSYFNS